MKKTLIKSLAVTLAAVIGGLIGLAIILAIILPDILKLEPTVSRPSVSVTLYVSQSHTPTP